MFSAGNKVAWVDANNTLRTGYVLREWNDNGTPRVEIQFSVKAGEVFRASPERSRVAKLDRTIGPDRKCGLLMDS